MTFKRILRNIVIVLLLLISAATGILVGTPAVFAQDTTGLKEYDEIITADAQSRTGMFTVHKVGDKHYLEVPTSVLGKEMMWYAEMTEMPVNAGTSGIGVGSRVVRWERRDDRLFVRDLTGSFTKRASLPDAPDSPGVPDSNEQIDPIAIAVASGTLPPIMLGFDIVAEGPDGSAVVDVSDTFAADILEFSVVTSLKNAGYSVSSPDKARSYVEEIKTFPTNVGISSFLTFADDSVPKESVSIVIYHSLTLLPEEPMMARYADQRVGYFTTGYTAFSSDGEGATRQELVVRWRLEKKDPTAELSEPVQPIVFYIGREVPNIWRPYIKQGIEDWQVAFEAAGFKNAIIAVDAPSEEEDPDWDPADTRYSVIRWIALDAANAKGPTVYDPRSGEILTAHIVVWASVTRLLEKYYFLQASANDPQARALPLPDEVMGQMMRYVVSHEVGHALGLRHNHRASQAFTVEQLRDPDFANEMGPVASIMSYGRINYVAQPGDGVTQLIPKIGPYDLWAINYGYRPIPNASTAEEEIPTLRTWAAEVASNPFLAHGGEDTASIYDPNVVTNNIGADRIEATRLGLANLERVMEYLVPATTRPGEDYSLLADMYKEAVELRQTWIGSVVKLIGGIEENRTLVDSTSPRYVRVERARQEAAVEFLIESLRTPTAFLRPDIAALTTPSNALDPVMTSQIAIVKMGLDPKLYAQLNDHAMLDPDNAYPLGAYLADIQNGVWEELAAATPLIDPMRREIQRVYLRTLEEQLNTEPTYGAADKEFVRLIGWALGMAPANYGNDFHSEAEAVLRELADRLEQAIPLTTDPATRVHLQDALDQVIDMVGVAAPAP